MYIEIIFATELIFLKCTDVLLTPELSLFSFWLNRVYISNTHLHSGEYKAKGQPPWFLRCSGQFFDAVCGSLRFCGYRGPALPLPYRRVTLDTGNVSIMVYHICYSTNRAISVKVSRWFGEGS